MTTSEYLTGNRKIRYPFKDDSTIAWTDKGGGELSDDLAPIVFGCFVDAMVHLKNPGGKALESAYPSIRSIKISGNTLSFVLAYTGYPGVHITCSRSTKDFPVIQGEIEWCWYTFVMSSDGIGEYADNADKIGDISRASLSFNTRCVSRMYGIVDSISIYGGTKPEDGTRYTVQEALAADPDYVLTGDVVIQEGNNIQIGSTGNAWELPSDASSIVLNAVAGAGAGKIVCSSQETDTTFKTPGLLSEDGHIRIFNDTCYDTEPWVCGNGTIQLFGKCTACCTCSMYESIVNDRLVPLRDKILADKKSLDTTLSTYDEYVKKWNERLESAYPEDIVVTGSRVALEAAGTNLSGGDVSGRLSRCGFSMIFRNDSFVDVTFSMDKFVANGTAFEEVLSFMQSENVPYYDYVDLNSDASPLFTFTLPSGRSATLGFFIRSEKMGKTDSQTGFIASATVSAYQGDRLVTTVTETL